MAKKNTPIDEVEELDRAYVRITGYQPKRLRKKAKKKTSPLLPICLVVLLALLLGGVTWFAAQYAGLFDGFLKMGDVSIGGVSMEGMTKKEAKEALWELAETYTAESMVIQVMETTLELSPVYTGITPDTDSAVEDAYREKAAGTFDLTPYLNLNWEAVQGAVDSLGAKYNTNFTQTVTAIEGTQPSLEADAPAQEDMRLVVTIGSPEYGLDTGALYQQVLDAYSSGVFLVTGECTNLEPEMPDLDALYEQTYIAPVDAVMDEKTFEITPEIYGYGFDLDKAREALAAADYGDSFEIPFEKIVPQVTQAALTSNLFCDVLGSAQTPYSGPDTNDRNTNLDIACKAINGIVLLPGESFGYNDTLGERTAEAGYKPAPSYVGGLTVDTLGGGICQVSSTLYYSTLFADLEILERHNHGYISDYIDPGMDATVTWDGADFRFRNNTNYPIRIEAKRENGFVSVQIIGTDERDYYVKMTYKIISTEAYDTVYEEMEADNEDGHKDGDVIVTPYKGYTVRAFKEKYHKETDELISSEQESYNIYNKRDKVICKIVDSTAPTGETGETTPETTAGTSPEASTEAATTE